MFWTIEDDRSALIGAWVAITLLVPALMQTKLPWYLNPFYPMFALGVGRILSYGFSRVQHVPSCRRTLLVAIVLLVSVVAEAKLIWYSYTHRASDRSAQGVLLREADRIRGRKVFSSSWNRADAFVLKGIVRARRAEAMDVQDFVRRSVTGEYLLSSRDLENPELVRLAVSGDHALYQKR